MPANCAGAPRPCRWMTPRERGSSLMCAARAATDSTRLTSPPPFRFCARRRASPWPSTATAPSPAKAAAPMCSRRSASPPTFRPPMPPRRWPRTASRFCLRRFIIPPSNTSPPRASFAPKPASARCLISSARCSTPRAPPPNSSACRARSSPNRWPKFCKPSASNAAWWCAAMRTGNRWTSFPRWAKMRLRNFIRIAVLQLPFSIPPTSRCPTPRWKTSPVAMRKPTPTSFARF